MRTSRYVIITMACMFFGACTSIGWLALHLTGKPQVFRSLAKVVVANRGNIRTDELDEKFDFYGTIIDTLESAELNREAAERVHALHPELKVSGVEIRVVQTKDSAIFNILATGSEPRYTQIFLNALLDEFMTFRRQLAEKGRGEFANIGIQERATTAVEHVDDWKTTIIFGGLGGGFLGIVVSLLVGLLGRPKQPAL